jgi:AAA+ ATPase superfamily predicted ATPase
MEPTQEYLKERFTYDEEAGVLIWRTHLRTARYVGKVAGCRNKDGYLRINLNKKSHATHRLIWVYLNGEIPEGLEIDHIDGDKTNNRIDNLRLANRYENMWNRKAKGYRFKDNHFELSIGHMGEYIYVGRYKTEAEAEKAYKEKCKELRGEFAV